MEQGSMKLNLGSNRKKLEGYVNIDINAAYAPDVVCDVTAGLPYPDNSAKAIRADDFLEHIPTEKTIFVMSEIWRVLEPDGVLYASTPDAEYGQGAYMDPTHINFWTEGRWLYFSNFHYRALYDIEANFRILECTRKLSDQKNRVYHLNVVAMAVKNV
jgi:predicted SAM-dependent methyltransferase